MGNDLECACHKHEHKHEHHHEHEPHHKHEHEHEHHHGEEEGDLRYAAISFVLLASGLLLGHFEFDWFQNNWVQLIWFIVAFLPVGVPVAHEALEAITEKDYFNEFTLMLLASIGAFCIGEYPEAVAVMLFYTVGEFLQDKAVGRATSDINKLLDVRPAQALVFRNGELCKVAPQDVKVGEIIEVKAGERVPLDGVIAESEALFDTSALTGESNPRNILPGETVLAGMICTNKPTRINVTKPFDQSELSRILELVRDSAEKKAPTELFIRKFARIYTPCVILLAALIVAIPAIIGMVLPSFDYQFADWLHRGLVFLVISCPCALVISVPLGYYGGIGAASRLGILFKGSNYLDTITKVNTIAFDKTGTLTSGQFCVSEIHTEGIEREKLLALLLATEQKSTHPIAQAIVNFAVKEGIVGEQLSDIQEIAGNGIEAKQGDQHILVGNLRLMNKHGIDVPAELNECISTLIICAIDGKYVGNAQLSDTLKEDAKEAIDRLHQQGINDLRLLSGDKREIVEFFAQKLGIDQAYGDLLPQDKAAHIESITQEADRTVAFVGDGMNDAPVLALSHVGIAMGGLGSDAAIESADIIIQTDQPSKLATAIEIGKATRGVVKQNIIGSIGIKVAVMLLGALGFASLWAAVFADVGVALLAVLNSIRISRMKFK
ncbi:MAG: cadmium-translocating P-type ATPase [Paludibacteraceae bacterium]|nr:cadmium-translocating P-type ATPase [Paludibacteraceae bacterium]